MGTLPLATRLTTKAELAAYADALGLNKPILNAIAVELLKVIAHEKQLGLQERALNIAAEQVAATNRHAAVGEAQLALNTRSVEAQEVQAKAARERWDWDKARDVRKVVVPPPA